jgi:hypothetical protein
VPSSHTLVIEKCDTKIDAQEPLSKGVNVKAGWIAGLKDGVDFMHARNVAHGDLVLPGGAEKATALERLPGPARMLAEQVFFGSDPFATRYARRPTLLAQPSAPPVVDLSKLA